MPAGSVLFEPAAGGLRGTLRVPADKSISHRAAIIGAISEGAVEIHNYLEAADTASTLTALEACGVGVVHSEPGRVSVHGSGLRGLKPPAGTIDAGNSGTTMRLLPGVLAGQQGCFTLDGDDSLRRRPMDRVAAPLKLMGVDIEASENRFAPLKICGGAIRAIDYRMPVASAQVKSAVLLAGLFGHSPSVVREPAVCRDHTEILLAAAGARIRRKWPMVKVYPVERLLLSELEVPGDLSSAAFFIVAATIIPGSDIELTAVGVNPTRTGIVDILNAMGADIELRNLRRYTGELVADIRVRAAQLSGVRVGAEISGRAIDELPLVALAAAFAAGDTVVEGAGELKLKESDRIRGVVDNLAGIGVNIEARPDGFVVHGGKGGRGGAGRGAAGGGFRSQGDHRLAMLGAVAGAASHEGVTVEGFECVAISYPGFRAAMESLRS